MRATTSSGATIEGEVQIVGEPAGATRDHPEGGPGGFEVTTVWYSEDEHGPIPIDPETGEPVLPSRDPETGKTSDGRPIIGLDGPSTADGKPNSTALLPHERPEQNLLVVTTKHDTLEEAKAAGDQRLREQWDTYWKDVTEIRAEANPEDNPTTPVETPPAENPEQGKLFKILAARGIDIS